MRRTGSRLRAAREPVRCRSCLRGAATLARTAGATHGNGTMRELFTLGVEEEYQLVDPSTREMVSRASAVLRADRSGAVEGEAQETMLEIGTPASHDAEEVAEALRQRRFQAGAAAGAEDLEILAAGAHPFSGWKHQEASAAERPKMLMGLFRQILRQEHIFGMHVHVAVPEEFDRVVLMRRVRAYAPHLIALSSSSPFLLGEDTGFSSFRVVSWRRFPFAGVPPGFRDSDEYQSFMDVLIRGGAIPDPRTVYWSLRPSPRYTTLELRMCDVCPRISDAVALAALARAMVVAAAEDRLPTLVSSLSPPLQDEVLGENEWMAARDGLEAHLIAPDEESGSLALRDGIARLLEVVRPIAESLGDGEALQGIERIVREGSAATRMRAVYERERNLQSVVDWLLQETRAGTGIDRRQESRAT
jgi:glutamate---cysteine ligase / carboxylate-amine ligase